MADPPSPTSSPNNKQEALLRVLKATTQLSAQITFYAAALGAILLIPGAQLPPALAVVAGGVGVNALSSLLERVARGEDVADEEIRRQVQTAINESKIAELLNRDEFQETIAQLRSWQNLLKYTIFRSEETIISRLVEQSRQYTTLVNELQESIAEDLEKLATREQSEEILTLLRQLGDEKSARHTSSQTSYGDYSAVAGPGGVANVNIYQSQPTPLPERLPPERLAPELEHILAVIYRAEQESPTQTLYLTGPEHMKNLGLDPDTRIHVQRCRILANKKLIKDETQAANVIYRHLRLTGLGRRYCEIHNLV